MSRWAALLIIILATTRASHGQTVPPLPPMPGPIADGQAASIDLADSSALLANRLQDFAADIASDLPKSELSERLSRDVIELSEAVRDFRVGLAKRPDSFAIKRSFSAIDAGWNGISSQVGQVSNVPTSLLRSSSRITQVETQIREAIGLNGSPGIFYNAASTPSGLPETLRLASALADRAAEVASIVRQALPELLPDADRLAREADAFHDGIRVDSRPDIVSRAYEPLRLLSDRFMNLVAATPNRSGVLRDALASYSMARALMEQNLGLAPATVAAGPAPVVVGGMPRRGFQLNVPGANIQIGGGAGVRVNTPGAIVDTGPAIVVAPGPQGSFAVQAEMLVGQINEFLTVWTPTAANVPLGGLMLSDARQLQEASIDFQQDVARGLDPGRLAYEFREVDLIWQRLARRVNRVAQGRMGPNIAQVYRIGETVSQLHRSLGLPGYPAVVERVP